ncbi:molybdopterin adenylyltransferase [Undibacterium sp. 10I3]|uniref:molybdopterin adenylyltransferase n=3 Tax=Undibacterium TaxID=401469 RepID=UPI002B222851|nr:molybdopterin adenylyltransferase [Undibacterium sp. 10I3]
MMKMTSMMMLMMLNMSNMTTKSATELENTKVENTEVKDKKADHLKIGLVSISDRASAGIYQDQGLPALQDWFGSALSSSWSMETRLIPDERAAIEQALIELVDQEQCHLVITTGGTGPSRRDVTPEATLAVATKEMPGFGEQMRQISLQFVPTAILSRQVAVIRETAEHAALILNLPGQPKSIKETLEGLKDADGKQLVSGIFAAVPYCIDLIGGPYIETHDAVCKVFRPKSAIRSKA